MAPVTTVQTSVLIADHAALPAPAARKKRAPRQPKTAPLSLFWVRPDGTGNIVVELNAKGTFLSTHSCGQVHTSESTIIHCACGGRFKKGEGFLSDCIHLQAAKAYSKQVNAEKSLLCQQDEDAFRLAQASRAIQAQGEFRLILPRILPAEPRCGRVLIPSFTDDDTGYHVDVDHYGFPKCDCPSFGWRGASCKHIPLGLAMLKAHSAQAKGLATLCN